MIRALLLAVSEVLEPRLRRTMLTAIGITAAAFVALWAAVAWLLVNTALFTWWWLESLIDVLGGVAALGLSWFLFPAVAILVTGLFLDRVVEAVERRHYPRLPPAAGVPLATSVGSALRLGLIALALNLLLLPFYLFLPGLNLLLFWSVNGYLLGREYFELVALRRLAPREAASLRRSHGLPVFLAGAVIAFLLTLPFINLAAPVIGAAFMLHLFERWRGNAGY